MRHTKAHTVMPEPFSAPSAALVPLRALTAGERMAELSGRVADKIGIRRVVTFRETDAFKKAAHGAPDPDAVLKAGLEYLRETDGESYENALEGVAAAAQDLEGVDLTDYGTSCEEFLRLARRAGFDLADLFALARKAPRAAFTLERTLAAYDEIFGPLDREFTRTGGQEEEGAVRLTQWETRLDRWERRITPPKKSPRRLPSRAA